MTVVLISKIIIYASLVKEAQNKTLEKDLLLIYLDLWTSDLKLNVCYVQRIQGAYSMYITNLLKHCVIATHGGIFCDEMHIFKNCFNLSIDICPTNTICKLFWNLHIGLNKMQYRQ